MTERTLAERLRAAMIKKKLSQKQVANAARVSDKTVQRILLGAEPTPKVLGQILEVIGEEPLPAPAAQTSVEPSLERASIAVLPFDNLTDDPTLELLADGLVEEILTSLAQFSELLVIARNSTFAFKGRPVDVREVAARVNARYVLEGSVRGSASAFRITAQLIDSRSGGHVWAERYDRVPGNVLQVQDEIAEAIAVRILPSLWRSEIGRIRRSDSATLDSWALAIRAWTDYIAKLTPAAATDGLVLARRAVALAPNYGFARIVLACLLCELGALPISTDAAASRQQAMDEAAEALRLSEHDPLVLLGVGYIRVRFGRPAEALEVLARALALCPNHAYIRSYFALALLLTGRAEEALGHFDIAERLSPVDTVLYRLLAFKAVALFELGSDDDACRELDRSLLLKPDYAVTLALKGAVCAVLGRAQEAEACAKAAEVAMTVPFAVIAHFLRATLPEPKLMPRIAQGLDRVVGAL
jgi:adenylate cyclase